MSALDGAGDRERGGVFVVVPPDDGLAAGLELPGVVGVLTVLASESACCWRCLIATALSARTVISKACCSALTAVKARRSGQHWTRTSSGSTTRALVPGHASFVDSVQDGELSDDMARPGGHFARGVAAATSRCQQGHRRGERGGRSPETVRHPASFSPLANVFERGPSPGRHPSRQPVASLCVAGPGKKAKTSRLT